MRHQLVADQLGVLQPPIPPSASVRHKRALFFVCPNSLRTVRSNHLSPLDIYTQTDAQGVTRRGTDKCAERIVAQAGSAGPGALASKDLSPTLGLTFIDLKLYVILVNGLLGCIRCMCLLFKKSSASF